MPNWRRVITSGSDASLNTLIVSNGITGSLLGTATTASYFSGTVVSASYAVSASFATTASFAPTAGNISAAVNLFNYYNFT